MASQKKLKVAIEKAKAGYELSARDLLLEIVQDEPDNKLAWLWLVGLLDQRGDLIEACENILRIDPADKRVQQRLTNLLHEEETEIASKVTTLLQAAERSFAAGEVGVSLVHLREVVDLDPACEKGWKLLAKHSSDLDEQVFALQKVSALDPNNTEKRALFERWAYYQKNPFELAAFYEERGKLDLAIGVYKKLALNAEGRRIWNRIIRELDRLEYLQREKIAHISPFFSIVRLTAGMPILFFFLLILHTGYDFGYLTFSMGLGFFTVLLGSFLMAVASVRSEHALWRSLGSSAGRASEPIRWIASMVGFGVMIVPFVLLSVDAFQRWTEGLTLP